MRFDDLAAALDASGMRWVMEGLDDEELCGLPYVALCSEATRRAHADNRSRVAVDTWRIELYTQQRSFEAEAALASALDDAGFSFSQAPQGPLDRSDALGAYLTYFTCSTIG